MHTNIDDALAAMRRQPSHNGLVGLEDRVLRAIENQSVTTVGTGMTLTAVTLALALGVFSNVVPSTKANAAPSLAPFGTPSALAPSTLLGEAR
jgi:hypothetical protein